MFKIAKEKLNALLSKLNVSAGIFIPVKRAGELN